ncbi:MYG1 family protein [Noviherbaspirillum sedimenti]|uniref:MYG1 family protein n=1 Tax=Noviherbaspirillum sedimenti TaxID=2320865 RepID=A0A3A3G8B2_9BURK|nr:MYG1 family protein [Noviherbaspirillum sedimenti]RJG03875.1 MYG1 family protein [Noviherbaspirillum sedimenti]
MIIATHSGKFHADDVWAVMVLDQVFPDCELLRTRDLERIAAADFAVDVGGVWEPQSGRFDHHQKGFSGARQSGVLYASAGLVWREYGARCVALLAQKHAGHALAGKEAQDIAYAIDTDVVQYLDMSDTGTARNAPGGYGLSAVVSGFNPNWLDEQQAGTPAAAEELRQRQFLRAMACMADVLINQVRYRVGSMLAASLVRQARRLEGGRLLLLENAALPWSSIVRKEMPEVLFVISHSIAENRYMLHTVPATADTFEARRDLPAAWAGLQGGELAAACGVADAVFCHNGLFIAAAISYEGALQMARLALADEAAPVQILSAS